MRKRAVYDFEKLFMGHNLKKKEPAKQSLRQLDNSNNGNISSGINLHVKTSQSPIGPSLQKTERTVVRHRTPIQLLQSKQRLTEYNNRYPREEVVDFFSGLGSKTLVKYAPANSTQKPVVRNLIYQLSVIKRKKLTQQITQTKIKIANRTDASSNATLKQKQPIHIDLSQSSSSNSHVCYSSVNQNLKDKPIYRQLSRLRTESSASSYERRSLVKPKIHSHRRYESIIIR